MIINKNDELVSLLKTLTKDSRTPDCSTVVSKVCFKKGEGIKFTFNENINYLIYKNPEVDFNAKVEGSLFVSTILSEFENGKETVNIAADTTSEIKVVINDKYYFEAENSDLLFKTGIEKYITFTKEQFELLKKDFVYTIANYFENPKTTDVVGFACHEGAVFKLLPSVSAYKISKFDALINETTFQQNYGHETKIWLLPRKVYDIVIGNEISMDFLDEEIYISTEKVYISYSPIYMGTNVFKQNLFYRGAEQKNPVKLSVFKNLNIKGLINNAFDVEEDKNVNVSVNNNKAEIKIENLTYNTDITTPDCKFYFNLTVLNFLLDILSDEATISEIDDETKYLIKDGDDILFIPKTSFLD